MRAHILVIAVPAGGGVSCSTSLGAEGTSPNLRGSPALEQPPTTDLAQRGGVVTLLLLHSRTHPRWPGDSVLRQEGREARETR